MKNLMPAALYALSLLPAAAFATETTPPPPPPEPAENCTAVSSIADAYIWAAAPNLNYGTESGLYTGLRWIGETQTLIAFDLNGLLPPNTILTSATFNVFVLTGVEGEEIRAHSILAPWSETTVTWNNFGGFDPAVEGTISATNWSWEQLDLTNLAESWMAGQENYGFLLEQDTTSKTTFASDEHGIEWKHPFLEVCWQDAPPTGCLGDTVWLDGDADGVFDAGEIPVANVVVDLWVGGQLVDVAITDGAGQYLFCQLAEGSYGVTMDASNFDAGGPLAGLLQTYDLDGVLDDATSYGLLPGEEFLGADFGYLPITNPGTGTPGYWKNHPAAWPVTSLTIGGVTYDQTRLLSYLGTPKKGDKTYIMAQALIAALLNVASGNDWSCIASDLDAAQAWLTANPIGTGGNADWITGQPIQQRLDDYNNGLLCAPHRD